MLLRCEFYFIFLLSLVYLFIFQKIDLKRILIIFLISLLVISPYIIRNYVNFERSKLVKRIEQRTANMIKKDAIQEVIKFNNQKIKKDKSSNKVIGIEELTKYLNNQIKLKQAKELIAIKTRQYAKRQTTWARSRMIKWTRIEPDQLSSTIKKITKSSLTLAQVI